jgi:hypothetical protein
MGFVVATIGEAEFLVVADPPAVQATELEDGTPGTRWWDNVTAQFTAWTKMEER